MLPGAAAASKVAQQEIGGDGIAPASLVGVDIPAVDNDVAASGEDVAHGLAGGIPRWWRGSGVRVTAARVGMNDIYNDISNKKLAKTRG